MYIYNYIHIWRAARNVNIPPANNYAVGSKAPRSQLKFRKYPLTL